MAVRFATSMVVAILANTVAAGTYSITSNLVGQKLLNAFYWQELSDPSHGRVYALPSCCRADDNH